MVHRKIDKQGLEVEFQQVDKNSYTGRYGGSIPEEELRHVYKTYHRDDGKAEVSSAPFTDLGQLEKHLMEIIPSGMEVMSKYYIPLTIGCTPYFRDMASGHIHTSVENTTENTWKELRQKLYSAQPIISLLSQNSPVVKGIRASDVRMLLSNWSWFTDFDNEDTSHYMSLAYSEKNNGRTIETRIPSSGPLFQLLAVAALIRIVIETNVNPVPTPEVKRNWDNVINYGSSSIVRIAVPEAINYDGIKCDSITVKATDLWKLFYNDNKDAFDKVLSPLTSKTRHEVERFYDMVANGLTLSDHIYNIIKKYEQNDRVKELTTDMYSFFLRSFKGETVINDLPSDTQPFMPILEKYYTISEMEDLVSKLKKSSIRNRIKPIDTKPFELFFNPHGPLFSSSVRNALHRLSTQGNYSLETYSLSPEAVKVLCDTKITKLIENNTLIPDVNFNVALTIGKEGGIL